MKHSDLCVGIDLGTTNSVIATCTVDGDRIETPVSRIERYTDMSNRNNARRESRELLPSCVYYVDMKDGYYEPIVGDFAKTVSLNQPFAVAKSIKRQMGQPTITIPGWKKEYPDQTPEAVSARVLRHMLASLEDYYGETITDAVITVPASFNLAQREATLKAAELAGIEVREENGSYRDDILISEPEAVIYDVLNQVQNGKINLPIDFSTQKKVLVFDIGGGTLDITLHEITKISDSGSHFEIRPLATNRFSMIAGDQFDQVLADWMYQQYLAEYRAQSADIARRIEENPQSAIPFLSYAEELKVKVSDRYRDRQRRGNPLPEDFEFNYGGYMPNGYNSENTITLEEFEDVLSPLLGTEYVYEDYKRFEQIKNDNHIIFPILDVLYKAAKKLQVDDITVDAVILNGGMSRLYLIEDRLTKFFQLKPISVSDPDKSVAQGAAVYHYYLHQDDQAHELHRRFLEEQERLEHKLNAGSSDIYSSRPSALPEETTKKTPNIQSIASVLNEAIYLGMKGGAVYLLADSGTDLPYQSPPMLNFSIAAGQKRLRIPIKQAAANGDYQTIASGDITFRRAMNREVPVAIQFLLHKNGILTLQAWTYSDRDGMNAIERGSVTLSFHVNDTESVLSNRGKKVLPPAGSRLMVANELSTFENLINGLKTRNERRKEELKKSLHQQKSILANCGNPEEFAAGSLRMLQNSGSVFMNMNFLPIARKFSRYWTEDEQKALSRYCISSVLNKALIGWPPQGLETTANIEAIKTVGVCGIPGDLERLVILKGEPRYRSALLYAFGYSGQEVHWICEEFQDDINNNYTLQDSLQALSLVFSKIHRADYWEDGKKAAAVIIDLIARGNISQNELVLSVIALGEICAQSEEDARVSEDEVITAAEQMIQDIPFNYDEATVRYSTRARMVAEQLIKGIPLSDEDESYLLSFLF